MLEIVETVEAFARKPIGRALRASCFTYAGVDEGLFAQRWWGRYSEDGMALLWKAVPVELSAAPHVSLIDASQVEHVDADSVPRLADRLGRWQAHLRAAVTRQVIVRPPGLTGMAFVGFTTLVETPYPIATFATRDEALAWLGRPDAAAALDALDALIAEDPLLVRLRRVLEADPAHAEPSGVARKLGVSTRTLQRRLQEAGTTFRTERSAARVRAAQARMLGSDEKLGVIALELGFASLAHLSQTFKEVVGVPPSVWRQR